MFLGWLKQALNECLYIEDVRALKHFVFHPRLNGQSNTCLICDQAVDMRTELWDEWHAEDCAYVVAIKRLKGAETLADYQKRKF